jgi:putative transposase
LDEITYFKRNLPHLHSDIGIFFVTFRLANSLPKGLLEKLRCDYKMEIERINKIINPIQKSDSLRKSKKFYFDRVDRIMCSEKNGESWLRNENAAYRVSKIIKEFDQVLYDLIAYCIMPNHVHLLIALNENEIQYQTDSLNMLNHSHSKFN